MRAVVTCAQMRAADKYTIETLGTSSQELMERAGAAIAEETDNLLRETEGKSVLAVCGGGNNGGDGWCAARLLRAAGYRAAVFTLTDKLSADCAAQREKFEGIVYDRFPEERYDVVIDAIFGTGFRGAPEGRFADAIARINESGAKVVSADIPSGLNGDNGSSVSCVRADVTVTIGELKTGLLLGNGADVCGKIVTKDIGIQLNQYPFAMICGEGVRVKKNTWAPLANSYMNSKASPYMWAMGSMEMTCSPGSFPNTPRANVRFDHRLR